jgi:hypothetical protein
MSLVHEALLSSFREDDSRRGLARPVTEADLQRMPARGVYRYSSHAQRKRLKAKGGPVTHVPLTLVRGSWKGIEASAEPDVYIITYACDARRDLTLVVNTARCEVITLYCIPAENRPAGKGFFRLWWHGSASS